MPKIRGVKPSSGNSTSPAFSLDKEESDTCITCNKLITGDAFECVWCRKWQYKVCINLSVGQYGAFLIYQTILYFSVLIVFINCPMP